MATNLTARAQNDLSNGVSQETGLDILRAEGFWGLAVESEYRTAYIQAAAKLMWKSRR